MKRDWVKPEEAHLSATELEVLDFVAQGLTNEEIGKKTLYSKKYIEAMLGLAQIHRSIYAKIGVRSRAEAAAWYQNYCSSLEQARNLLEANAHWPETLYEMRTRGSGDMVISKGDIMAAQIKSLLPTISDTYRSDFLRIYAGIRVEQVVAYTEILEKGLRRKTYPLIDEIERIAKQTQDLKLQGLGLFLRGHTQYLLHNHSQSVYTLKKALSILTDPNEKLRALRPLIINYAVLQAEMEYKQTEEAIITLIESGHVTNLERVCLGLEGIGYARGILRHVDPFEKLEDARDVYTGMKNEGRRVPFLLVGIGRSELVAASRGGKKDISLIAARCQEPRYLAKEYMYQRHWITIMKLGFN